MMKRKNKATIIPPSWLSVEKLKDNLQQEQTQSTFSELPFHYLEIAQMLLKDGGGDIIGSHQIRTLLSDIRELRGSKMRQGLQSIDEHYLQMNNISKMEIESIREFFQAALNEVRLITVQ
ncbi:hypothetical protein BC833DRAFT_587156 [Globomyces pollinis-pini]|nr:hypothetical protein BC833DRAFT_587156 [Globomyces pollinis-pini]